MLVGVLLAFLSDKPFLALKTSLPWSVIAGLVLSSMAHRIFRIRTRIKNDKRTCMEEEEMEETRQVMLTGKEWRLNEVYDQRKSVS